MVARLDIVVGVVARAPDQSVHARSANQRIVAVISIQRAAVVACHENIVELVTVAGEVAVTDEL